MINFLPGFVEKQRFVNAENMARNTVPAPFLSLSRCFCGPEKTIADYLRSEPEPKPTREKCEFEHKAGSPRSCAKIAHSLDALIEIPQQCLAMCLLSTVRRPL